MNTLRAPAVVMWIVGWAVTGAGAAGLDPDFSRLSRDPVTPHVPFAHPHVGGTVRALVIAPAGAQRETVELAQRLSLAYTPLFAERYDKLGPYDDATKGSHPTQFAKRYRADVDLKLRYTAHYDLIVLGKMKWDALPEPVRQDLLARVRAGTGLLYVGPWGALDKDLHTALRPDTTLVRGLPPLDGAARFLRGKAPVGVRRGTLGRGRVVVVDYGENAKTLQTNHWNGMLECLTPFRSNDPLYYDYWFSLLARAALWATDRAPACTLGGMPTGTLTIAQAKLPGEPIRLTLGGDARAGALVHWTVRDRGGRVVHTHAQAVDGNTLAIRLPYLAGGDKIVDVWLRDSQARVVDWASIGVHVTPPVGVTHIKLDTDAVKPGQSLAGTVVLSGPLGAGRSVRVRAEDTLGRVLAAGAVGSDGRFSLAVAHPITCAGRLVAQVVQGERVVHQHDRVFYINRDDFDARTQDFTFHIWDGPVPHSRSCETWLDQFRTCEIDTVYAAGALFQDRDTNRQVARLLARADLRGAPYATRLFLASRHPPYKHLHPIDTPDGPCVRGFNQLAKSADEILAAGGHGDLVNVAHAYGPLGAAYYSLGDENCLTSGHIDICFSQGVRASFQRYLKGMYPSLAALNREWGSDFKAWGDVKAITFINAAKQKRYAQWLDHRMHMDRLFTKLHTACIEIIRRTDPDAKVGLEGPVYPTKSFTGYNLYEMLPQFRYFVPYNHLPETHAFTFLPPRSLRGTWFGNYEGDPLEMNLYMPWHGLFKGANCMMWFYSGAGGIGRLPGNAGLAPDLGPQPLLERVAREIREIKSGVGKLLITAERSVHPIGVYLSNACLHASTVRPVETTWENSLKDFHYALRDGAYQYRFVAPPHVLAGELRKLKVLILPYSQALSAAEVAKIKAFVTGGGLLIADFSPGIMTEHGRRLPTSTLADVFGQFKRMHIQRIGKGRAVYLADYVKGYHTRRRKGLGRGSSDGLARLVSQLGGVSPFATVTDPDGKTRQDVEVAGFAGGDATFLTLLRVFAAGSASTVAKGAEGETAATVKGSASPVVHVKLPRTAHVYEVRSHAYLGWLGALKRPFANGEPRIFALLPDRVRGLSLRVAKPTYRRGDVVSAMGTLQPDSLRGCATVVRLEVSRAGRVLDHYIANVPLKGRFSHTLPLALNEEPGTYTLRAEEIISGVRAETQFKVE